MRIGCLGVQSGRMIDQDAIRARYNALGPFLNERDRRLFAASEARAAGRGGITAVSRTTGIARSTIGRGLADLRSGAVRCSQRVRRESPQTDVDRLFDTKVIVRRVGVGAAPFTWEVVGANPGIPLHVSSERFRSMEAAYS